MKRIVKGTHLFKFANCFRWESEVAEIDWTALGHAYGVAKDVPIFLSGIVSGTSQIICLY